MTEPETPKTRRKRYAAEKRLAEMHDLPNVQPRDKRRARISNTLVAAALTYLAARFLTDSLGPLGGVLSVVISVGVAVGVGLLLWRRQA
jgi:p-aminobenzoyl-glutamate transporter AbgT